MTIISLLEKAIDMESEGIAFYRGLSNRSVNHQAKEIFRILSEDEKKHKTLFEDIKESIQTHSIYEPSKELVFRDYSGFKELQEEVDHNIIRKNMIFKEQSGVSVSEALGIAIKAEQEGIRYYLDIHSSGMDDIDDTSGDLHKIMSLIIAEEMLHLHFLTLQHDHLKDTGFWFTVDSFSSYREESFENLTDEMELILEEAENLLEQR